MTMDPYGQWMGTPMDDREIDTLLETTGWGVITLAADDVPYSLPISFGYDGDDVYFVFIRDTADNEKFDFIAEGKTARLLVTEVHGRFDWQSIAVSGPVRAVDPDTEEWDHLVESLEDNAWFSMDFERSSGVQNIEGYRLEPEEVRGLEVTGDE